MAKKVAVLAVNPVNGCGLFQYLEAFFEIVKVWDIYISCRYILLQKKLDLKVVKLYPLHSQDSKVILLT